MHASFKPSKKLIYLDYAATTPVRPEVLRAMAAYWSKSFGNPSALYKLGLQAQEALRSSRSSIASTLSCRPDEVIFTAGGSESINLAIMGSARAFRASYSPPRIGGVSRSTLRDEPSGSDSKRGGTKPTHQLQGHIITSTIEHHAVLRAVEQLEKEGFAVTKIGVDSKGFFKLDELKKAIRPDTFLVSLMYANNEIGTIEPIAEIGKLIKKINSNRLKSHASSLTPLLFHSDACQAAGYLDLDVNKLHVDLLTINGSKLYGPKQTGCLYVRKGTQLEPVIYGGGQERNLRSGTENVPGIVGFGKALELANKERVAEIKRLAALQKFFFSELLRRIPKVHVNGPDIDKIILNANRSTPDLKRLPNNINVSFPGVDGEALVLYLDAKDIAAATGSACASQSSDPSHVLQAIGVSPTAIRGSIRFTLGKYTTKAEMKLVLAILPGLIDEQRRTVTKV